MVALGVHHHSHTLQEVPVHIHTPLARCGSVFYELIFGCLQCFMLYMSPMFYNHPFHSTLCLLTGRCHCTHGHHMDCVVNSQRFTSVNSLFQSGIDMALEYPVQLEPFHEATLLAAMPPVFSPPIGVVPSMVFYQVLSYITAMILLQHFSFTGDLHKHICWLLTSLWYSSPDQEIKHRLTSTFQGHQHPCSGSLPPSQVIFRKKYFKEKSRYSKSDRSRCRYNLNKGCSTGASRQTAVQ